MFKFGPKCIAITLVVVGLLGVTEQVLASPLTIESTGAQAFTTGKRIDSVSERNLQVVLDFYEKGLNQKDADAALVHVGNRYTQHNPRAADGPEVLICTRN